MGESAHHQQSKRKQEWKDLQRDLTARDVFPAMQTVTTKLGDAAGYVERRMKTETLSEVCAEKTRASTTVDCGFLSRRCVRHCRQQTRGCVNSVTECWVQSNLLGHARAVSAPPRARRLNSNKFRCLVRRVTSLIWLHRLYQFSLLFPPSLFEEADAFWTRLESAFFKNFVSCQSIYSAQIHNIMLIAYSF